MPKKSPKLTLEKLVKRSVSATRILIKHHNFSQDDFYTVVPDDNLLLPADEDTPPKIREAYRRDECGNIEWGFYQPPVGMILYWLQGEDSSGTPYDPEDPYVILSSLRNHVFVPITV